MGFSILRARRKAPSATGGGAGAGPSSDVAERGLVQDQAAGECRARPSDAGRALPFGQLSGSILMPFGLWKQAAPAFVAGQTLASLVAGAATCPNMCPRPVENTNLSPCFCP